MKQLDLGCGSTLELHTREGYEGFGVDIVDFHNKHIKTADLAIEPIPFKADTFELVTAYDFMEHIPKMLYLSTALPLHAQRRNCMIELFNEIYRVLKHDGVFYFEVPRAGTTQFWGDPTHVTEWCEDSVNYYSGDYFGFHDDYGHRSKFKKIVAETHPAHSWRMVVTLKAIKPMEPPYEP